jgi:hypothetical protein
LILLIVALVCPITMGIVMFVVMKRHSGKDKSSREHEKSH